MEVKNPRRILFVGPPDSGVLSLLKDLTGSSPSPRILPVDESPDSAETNLPTSVQTVISDSELHNKSSSPAVAQTAATIAGLTHSLDIKNNYYQAQIPIWIDETSTPDEWKEDFLSEEAGEVIRAVGAWVLCFRKNQPVTDSSRMSAEEDAERLSSEAWIKSMMSAVRAAIENACGGVDLWDGVLLCVGIPSYSAGRPATEGDAPTAQETEWEDVCWDLGFEYVDASVTTNKKQASAGESRGVRRILEALEANDWEDDLGEYGDEAEDDDDFGDFTSDSATQYRFKEDFSGLNTAEDAGFARERQEMEKEMLDLKLSLNGVAAEDGDDEDEATQVEDLENAMGKVLAVKDMTAHMPESERKKFAARAVRDIMKTI